MCLTLDQSSSLVSNVPHSKALLLCLEDLRPCTAFNDLCQLELNIKWNIGLTDDELVALTSAWPHMEILFINTTWG